MFLSVGFNEGLNKLSNIFIQIKEEVKQMVTGKTIDALFPPIVYVIGNSFFGLKIGIILALSIAIILGLYRVYKKESFLYALGGLIGIGIASAFAYFGNNAANYFLPKVITSGLSFLLGVISLIVGKPLAAWVSHLSRGWKLEWFFRDDVKPAYSEVTIVWTILFLIRMILQIILLRRGNLVELGWANIMLGFPATFIILILTLVYGMWRLKNLGGPGVDEFINEKEPPWKGQTRGF